MLSFAKDFLVACFETVLDLLFFAGSSDLEAFWLLLFVVPLVAFFFVSSYFFVSFLEDFFDLEVFFVSFLRSLNSWILALVVSSVIVSTSSQSNLLNSFPATAFSL